MADLSFREEISEIREDLRRLDAKLDQLFLLQLAILAKVENRAPDSVYDQWIEGWKELLVEPSDETPPDASP